MIDYQTLGFQKLSLLAMILCQEEEKRELLPGLFSNQRYLQGQLLIQLQQIGVLPQELEIVRIFKKLHGI